MIRMTVLPMTSLSGRRPSDNWSNGSFRGIQCWRWSKRTSNIKQKSIYQTWMSSSVANQAEIYITEFVEPHKLDPGHRMSFKATPSVYFLDEPSFLTSLFIIRHNSMVIHWLAFVYIRIKKKIWLVSCKFNASKGNIFLIQCQNDKL